MINTRWVKHAEDRDCWDTLAKSGYILCRQARTGGCSYVCSMSGITSDQEYDSCYGSITKTLRQRSEEIMEAL